MVWNDGRAPVQMTKEHVAPFLANGQEPKSDQCPRNLPVRKRWYLLRQDRLRLDADPFNLDSSAFGQALDFEVKFDRFADVRQRFFSRRPLGMASWQERYIGDPNAGLSFLQDDVEFHGFVMLVRRT